MPSYTLQQMLSAYTEGYDNAVSQLGYEAQFLVNPSDRFIESKFFSWLESQTDEDKPEDNDVIAPLPWRMIDEMESVIRQIAESTQ